MNFEKESINSKISQDFIGNQVTVQILIPDDRERTAWLINSSSPKKTKELVMCALRLTIVLTKSHSDLLTLLILAYLTFSLPVSAEGFSQHLH